MRISKMRSKGVTGVRIKGTLDISVAEELRKALAGLLSQSSEPVVDLSGLDSVDATALQLLYAARKTAAANGGSIRFEGLDGAAGDCAASLGLPETGLQEADPVAEGGGGEDGD